MRRSFPAALRVVGWAVLLALAPASCRKDDARERAAVSAPARPLAEVLAEHSPRIIAMPGVTAIGEGRLPDGRACVRIYILERNATLEAQLPHEIEGYPVVIEVSGEIRALPDSQ